MRTTPHPRNTAAEQSVLCPHLTAETIVGYIQSEKRLQA